MPHAVDTHFWAVFGQAENALRRTPPVPISSALLSGVERGAFM
jgi:hypothetical protein